MKLIIASITLLAAAAVGACAPSPQGWKYEAFDAAADKAFTDAGEWIDARKAEVGEVISE